MASDSDTSLQPAQPDQPEQGDDAAQTDRHVVNTQGGDNIHTGNITGTGIAIGAGSRVDVTITEERAYNVAGLANPYLGLRAFTAAERDIFAGRECIVRTLVDRLSADNGDRLLFIVGASGSGKSSLARAGLLPALADRMRDTGYAVQTWIIDHPGRMPTTTLSRLLVDASDNQSPQLLLLFIDQFEEIFSQADAAERATALNLLANHATSSTVPVRIITTMRSDFLPQLVADVRFEPCEQRKVVVRKMSVDELTDAIQRPIQVRYADKRIEPGLVERLAVDAAADAAYLPLLQVTLEDLWRGGGLRLAAFHGLANAIQRRAEAVYAYTDYDGLQQELRTPEEQATILALFLDLVRVSLNDDQHYVRWRRTRAELIKGNSQREQLITDLTEARLLRTDRELIEENGDKRQIETVNIVHEALVSEWSQLKEAIDAKREYLRRRERFLLALREWQTNKQQADYLLHGVRLAEADVLRQHDDGIFMERDALSFYEQSRQRHEHQEQIERERLARELQKEREINAEREVVNQRLRQRAIWLLVLGVVALLTAGVAGLFGVQSRLRQLEAETQAREAQRQALARAAQNAYFLPDLDQALTLAMAAIDKSPSGPPDEVIPIIYRAVNVGSRNRFENLASGTTRVAISPNGNFGLSTFDQDILLWDAATGQKITTFQGHEGTVRAITFSPDGSSVLSGASDYTVRLWDVETGQEVRRFLGHERDATEAAATFFGFSFNGVWSVAFSSDGSQAVSGATDGTFRLWEVATGKELHRFEIPEKDIFSVAFSPDDSLILSGSSDGVLRLWDAASGEIVREFEQHDGSDFSVAFSPDGNFVLSGSGDVIILWDLSTGKEVKRFEGHAAGDITAVFSPDGKIILSGSIDQTVRLWDVQSGQEIRRFQGHSSRIWGVSIHPNGETAFSAAGDGIIRQWDLTTRWNEKKEWNYTNEIASIAISLDGTMALSGSTDGSARIWAVDTGTEIYSTKIDTPTTDLAVVLDIGSVTSVAFAQSGRMALYGGGDGTIYLWNISTNQVLHRFKGHEGVIQSLAFSKDGDRAVSAGRNLQFRFGPLTRTLRRDKTIRVWDVQTGEELRKFEGHEASIESVVFSPSGKQVLSGSRDETMCLWDIDSGLKVRCFEGQVGAVRAVAFNSNGSIAISGSSLGYITLWDVATGQIIRSFRASASNIRGVAFSPDDKFIMSGSTGGIQLWDAATAQRLRSFTVSPDIVNSVAFSSDGSRVIAGTEGGRILSWRIDSLVELIQWTRINRYKAEISCEQRRMYNIAPLCK